MARKTQKAEESVVVRIREKTKERLEKVVRRKSSKDDVTYTELEFVDKYVSAGLQADERILGL